MFQDHTIDVMLAWGFQIKNKNSAEEMKNPADRNGFCVSNNIKYRKT